MSTDTRSFAERMLNTYSEKPITKIDELRALDKKATKNAYRYVYSNENNFTRINDSRNYYWVNWHFYGKY